MRAFIVGMCFVAACSEPAVPAEFEKLVSPVGGTRSLMCVVENHSKRFVLEGYLQLPSNVSISGRKTNLDFFRTIDESGTGAGRSISVGVETPGDIDDLWANAKDTKGVFHQEGKLDEDALKIRAKNGKATARDKLKLTVEQTVRMYNSQEVKDCRLTFVTAERI